jgi:ATP-dependent Clp protease ATP-binding subunit ClpA
MTTVNMSDYQEVPTVSTLKGAPLGYGKGDIL